MERGAAFCTQMVNRQNSELEESQSLRVTREADVALVSQLSPKRGRSGQEVPGREFSGFSAVEISVENGLAALQGANRPEVSKIESSEPRGQLSTILSAC